ncbi:MAG: HU family DNA-binding protein [Proteobacteria bacterium]|nr:HU family DNA-binding protein [Pseudomonadota bacterium]
MRGIADANQQGSSLPDQHDKPHVMMAGLVNAVTKQLKEGVRIRMSGPGTLEVRKRPARMGRNPATGEAIKIKAGKKIAFRADKELKPNFHTLVEKT